MPAMRWQPDSARPLPTLRRLPTSKSVAATETARLHEARDATPAARHALRPAAAAQEPGVHRRHGPDPGPRDRGDDGDLQRRPCDLLRAAAVSRRRSAGDGVVAA